MKKTSILLNFLGFLFEFVIPFALFGLVIPYTHGTLEAGLTGFGYFALFIFVLVVGRRLKKSTAKMPKSLFRGIILTALRIVRWVIIVIAAEYLLKFAAAFSAYLSNTIFFVVVGWMFYLLDDIKGED